MPLGNGKLGVNVWATAGNTIGLLVSHVDALDEYTNLVKLGRIMVHVIAGDSEVSLRADDGGRSSNSSVLVDSAAYSSSSSASDGASSDGPRGNYTVHSGFLGSQPPAGTFQCTTHTACPTEAAAACDAQPGCMGFGLSFKYNNGVVAELQVNICLLIFL
jgi:hypothetical protein